MEHETALVDSAEVTAEEVEAVLLREGLLKTHGIGSVKCYVTDVSRQINKLGKLFFGNATGKVSRVELEHS